MSSITGVLRPSVINIRWLVRYSGYIGFLVLAVYFSLSSPIFLTGENLINILRQSSILGIVACGFTAILISGGNHVIRGGIDLSLANNLAITTTATAFLLSKGYSLATAFGIAATGSLVIGLINAFTVVRLKVSPLLGTLAMMYLLQGIELLLSKTKVINVTNPALVFLAEEKLIGIPITVWVFFAVAFLLHILFSKSVHGNWANAVGGNPQAALNAGINVDLVLASTYVIAAVTAIVASLLVTARLSGSVPGMGDIMLLDILLAGYMSAIFSHLSIPNIQGAFLSSLFVGMLVNGFTLINVSTYWVYGIKGTLILLAVSVTATQQRRLD